MQAGLTDSILGLLSSMDWTADLAGLQKAAALGDAQHVHTVRALHQETRQGLADTLYRYSAQVGLSAQAVTRILEYLAKATPDTATGQLDGVTAALVMAVVSAMDVSGVGRGEVELPIVKDPNFLTTVGREVEGRSRKWECPGVKIKLQKKQSSILCRSIGTSPTVMGDSSIRPQAGWVRIYSSSICRYRPGRGRDVC